MADVPGLRVIDVRKSFATPEGAEVHALDGVSLDIAPGEFFVLLGPSGCGKTTLLRSIAGLEALDGGSIELGGHRIDRLPPYERPVNTVFQSYALFPHLTVGRNIAFGLEMDHMPRAAITERVEQMLDLVHLPGLGARHPIQLSGGQQQRVALARALAKTPQVLLLDEPLAALDLKLRRGMQAELTSLQRTTGVSFVFVTHDQEEALSMGDRIAVFDSGRIAQIGTPEDIYERPVDRFVADFIGETNFFEVDVTVDASGATFCLPGGPAVALPDGTQPGRSTVALRPERTALRPLGDPAGGAPVRVTSRTYMGTDVRATVVLRDGTDVLTRTPVSQADHALRPGDDALLALEPGRARAVRDARTAAEADALRADALVDS